MIRMVRFSATALLMVLLTRPYVHVFATPTHRVENDDFAVAGYLPEWRYEGAAWDVISRHVSHLILFSLEISPSGEIGALDRIPRKDLLDEARRAASMHGTRLLICFGGNGRSAGFSAMVRDEKKRSGFVASLIDLCDRHGFDGVDYNWEYPGYVLGRGYLPESEIEADYRGLFALLKDTRAAFGPSSAGGRQITLSYYPDGKQESLLSSGGAGEWVDYMYSMSYDQTGGHHSTFEFAVKTVDQMLGEVLPREKLCLGLPFYGRSVQSGDWTSFEDIVQKHHPLDPAANVVDGRMGFNGVRAIEAKTQHAIKSGIGGVMIWEVGQDCRLKEVVHGDTKHIVTCPDGSESSLLVAISRTLTEYNKTLPVKMVNPSMSGEL